MRHLSDLLWQPFLIIPRAVSQKTVTFYLGMTVLSIRWRQGSSWNSPFESNQASLHRWLHTYPSSKTHVLHLLQTTADSSTWPGSFASSWQGGTHHWQTQTQGGSQDAKRVMSKSQQLSQGSEQAVMCWLKNHKSTRPLPLFPQESGGTGTIMTNAIPITSYLCASA